MLAGWGSEQSCPHRISAIAQRRKRRAKTAPTRYTRANSSHTTRCAMSGDVRRKVTRRRVLQTGAGLAAAGSLAAGQASAAPLPIGGANVYESLGIKPVINATGTVTVLGGSL